MKIIFLIRWMRGFACGVLAVLAAVCAEAADKLPPTVRLGTDAAIRFDDDGARLQFLLRIGGDYRETVNDAARRVETDCSLDYKFIRPHQKMEGTGRATLRVAENGAKFSNDITVHKEKRDAQEVYLLTLRADDFAGKEWCADAKKGNFPAKPKSYNIGSGEVKAFSFVNAVGRRWTIAFPKKVRYEMCDTRTSGKDNLTVRFSCQLFRPLAAGVGKVVSCTVTASDGKVQCATRDYVRMGQGASWLKLNVASGIRPASALDFSRMPTRKIPAGSEGALSISTNGEFRFKSTGETPRRLFGCRAARECLFPDKKTATAYTKELTRYGYNAIRLSWFDSGILSKGAKGLQLNIENCSKFDQLVTSATREGLYTVYDVLNSHSWTWSDLGMAAPGSDMPGSGLGTALCVCDERARKAWQNLVEILYFRKNKIASKNYPDDPAVPLVVMMSSGSAFSTWSSLQTLPFMRDHYGAWLADKRKTEPDFMQGKVCGTDDFGVLGITAEKASSIRRFLAESEVASTAKVRDAMVAQKAKALFSVEFSERHYGDVADLRATAGDYACDSFSIDSPRHLGEQGHVPYRLDNVNPLVHPDPVLPTFVRAKLPPRAECVLSWDAPPPSSWCACSGLLVGAWAGLHGWDALLRGNDAVASPFAAANERAVYALYARGDMTVDAPTNALVIANGALTVQTERTAGGFSPKADGRIEAGELVAVLKGFRAAVWVSSLTDAPIAKTKRMLLTHLTEMSTEGTLFADSRRDYLLSFGRGPTIIRDGSADITLAVEKPSNFKVYALETDGTRGPRIPTDVKDGKLTFTVAVNGVKNAQYTYEVVRD